MKRLFLFVLGVLVLTLPVKCETPIKLNVLPKVALANPYKATTFRIVVRVEPHPDNRILSLSADCGGNAYSSQHEVDQITYTRFYEMKVVRDCSFVACVNRITNGKVVRFCDPQVVPVTEHPP